LKLTRSPSRDLKDPQRHQLTAARNSKQFDPGRAVDRVSRKSGCRLLIAILKNATRFPLCGSALMSDSRFARLKECSQPEPERPPSVLWTRPGWQYCPSCKMANDNAPIRPVSMGQNPQFSGTQTVLRTRVAAIPYSRCFGLRDVGAAPQNTGIPFGGVGRFGLVVEVDGVVGSPQPVAALPTGSRLFFLVAGDADRRRDRFCESRVKSNRRLLRSTIWRPAKPNDSCHRSEPQAQPVLLSREGR
jgi:hypothetical protein